MVDRIKEIIGTEGLTSASFADLVGVQRSSMSHILNGRNNPSLDFIVKTLQQFPKLNPDWLLNGVGEMYRSDLPADPLEPVREPSIFNPAPEPVIIPKPVPEPKTAEKQIEQIKISEKYVDKILIFYSDRTYDEFYRSSKTGI